MKFGIDLRNMNLGIKNRIRNLRNWNLFRIRGKLKSAVKIEFTSGSIQYIFIIKINLNYSRVNYLWFNLIFYSCRFKGEFDLYLFFTTH